MSDRLQSQRESSRIRLIVIDDHPLFRRGLVSMINNEPDMVVCAQAEKHHQALDLIASKNPDIATVDISLGESDGLSLIKDIRERFSSLPVLVISMHDESLYAERAIRAGARGYISKQQMDETVLLALRQVLRGEDYISAEISSFLSQKYLHGHSRSRNHSVAGLSDRQLEVFRLIGESMCTRQIAERMHLSVKTIESHREHIKSKLTLHSGAELARAASIWVATGRMR